ncbi:hypothetical protein, partial [Streptomyces sp. RKAG290]|uniref:hypothetical protein n=1 Tax=Streptomyces sp. RKAG290 TaxID=2888348 RepID=UPI0020345AD8
MTRSGCPAVRTASVAGARRGPRRQGPDHVSVARRDFGVDALDVQLRTHLGDRERPVAIHQDGQRTALGGLTGGTELAGADDLLRQAGVHVRVVEESERELLAQQATYGGVDTVLADAAGAHELDHDPGAFLAAELV